MTTKYLSRLELDSTYFDVLGRMFWEMVRELPPSKIVRVTVETVDDDEAI